MKTIELRCKQEVNDNGQLIYEEYQLNNKFHNEHGPAIKAWNNGITFNSYYLNNELHNEHGPAVREWDDNNGQLCHEAYYLNHELLSKEEWERRVNSCVGKIVEIDGKKYRLEEV